MQKISKTNPIFKASGCRFTAGIVLAVLSLALNLLFIHQPVVAICTALLFVLAGAVKIDDRFLSGPVNPLFYRFFVKANAFRAGSGCVGCGRCAEKCPMNNIRLQNGKPLWGGRCTHCMACIGYCPTEAIEYGKKSVGKPRYHFEEL